MNEFLEKLDGAIKNRPLPKDRFIYLKEQEESINQIITKHRNDLNFNQFVMKIIHHAHECGFEELVRIIFDRIGSDEILSVLKESLENFLDQNGGKLCQVNNLFSGFGFGSPSPFGMLSEMFRNNVQKNYLSSQYGDEKHVVTFLKYCFNDFVNLVFCNDPYTFFKNLLYSLIIVRKEDVGKRRKVTTVSDVTKGLYRFNFKSILQLCETSALRKQLFSLLILVFLTEIPQEQLETLLPSFMENEILDNNEILGFLLETLKEKNVENSIILMIYNSLLALETELGREEESRGLNILCKVYSLKDKILNDYPNMFYSEDEVFLRQINSSTDIDVVIYQLESKTVEDLVKFINSYENTNNLPNSTLACIYVIIERVTSGLIDHSITEQLLTSIKGPLLEFINFATNDFCKYYKEIVLEGKDVAEMDTNTRRWKETILKLFHLIGNFQNVFFETDLTQEQTGLVLLAVDNQIIEDMSYLYLFSKVLESTGCSELSKNLSQTLLRLLNISNTDYRVTINNNDIKELFNGSLYVALCTMKDDCMKIPMGEEEMEAIQYMHNLFRNNENISIQKIVIETLGFMLYSIVNSEEEAYNIISNPMMFVIPRLATFRDSIEIKLSLNGHAKANVPQPLYALTKFIDLSTSDKTISPRNIYTALCIMVGIVEAYSKHFHEKINGTSVEKRPTMFLYIEECSKFLVFKFAALIPLLNEISCTNRLDNIYLRACTAYMSFISAFLLKLSKSRKTDVVTILIKSWFEKLFQEPKNPNSQTDLENMNQLSVFFMFHHLLKSEYLFQMISHENSIVGVKLLSSAEKTGKMLEFFAIYISTWLKIAMDENSIQSDKTTSKSLSKVIMEIFNQYISGKEAQSFESYSHIDAFVNSTLTVFKSGFVGEVRATLLKTYDKVTELDLGSLAFLNSLEHMENYHPLLNFLEILEKKPKEDGISFPVKYNTLLIFEKMARNMKRVIPKYPEKIDLLIDFLKKYSVVQRLIAVVNTNAMAADISEEALNSYFNYYETLLEAILPLLTVLPKNDEYSIDLISKPPLTTLLCLLIQNNQKNIIKKLPKLLSTIFTLYEKCLQIFVVFSKTSREQPKLEELRDKLFSKTFIFIIKLCFVKITPGNQQSYLWNRSDDPGRDLPNSLINVISEITQAITSAPNLFKNYSQVLEEHNVLANLQNVDLPHPKLKLIIDRLSNNTSQPKENTSNTSPSLKQFTSFAKPTSNSTGGGSNTNAGSSNNGSGSSSSTPIFRPPTSAPNTSNQPPKQVFRPPPRK